MKTINLFNTVFVSFLLLISFVMTSCSDEDTVHLAPVFEIQDGEKHRTIDSDGAQQILIDTWREYTFSVIIEKPEELQVHIDDNYASILTYSFREDEGVLYITINNNFSMEKREAEIYLANNKDTNSKHVIKIEQSKNKMPIEYFSRGNIVGEDQNTFSDENKKGDDYLFLQAYNTFAEGKKIGDKKWYLPTSEEWAAIIPLESSKIRFHDVAEIEVEEETAVVSGLKIKGPALYKHTGEQKEVFAIRFIGSEFEAAYRYEFKEDYRTDEGQKFYKFVITMRKLIKNSGLQLKDISSAEYWDQNNENDKNLLFPATVGNNWANFWTADFEGSVAMPYLMYMNTMLMGRGMQMSSTNPVYSNIKLVYQE